MSATTSTKLKLSPPVHVDTHRDPRHNALVHGLTANFPLDDHEHQILAEEIDVWTKELGPVCEAESAIIHAAALARVQRVRCARAEAAAIRQARKEAESHHIAKERARIRKLAQSLAAEPHETAPRLEATKFGREWLAGRWRSLDATLAQGLCINSNQRQQTMHLLGLQAATPGPDASPFIRQLWSTLHDAQYAAAPEYPHGPPPDDQTQAIEARRQLRALIAGELARLVRLDDEEANDPAQQESADLDRQTRAELALVQTTPEARLRQRYAREAGHDLRSNINLLMRIRQDRRKAEDDERKEARRRPARDTSPRHHEPWLSSSGATGRPCDQCSSTDTPNEHQSPETTLTQIEATPIATKTYPLPAGRDERRTDPIPTQQTTPARPTQHPRHAGPKSDSNPQTQARSNPDSR